MLHIHFKRYMYQSCATQYGIMFSYRGGGGGEGAIAGVLHKSFFIHFFLYLFNFSNLVVPYSGNKKRCHPVDFQGLHQGQMEEHGNINVKGWS